MSSMDLLFWLGAGIAALGLGLTAVHLASERSFVRKTAVRYRNFVDSNLEFLELDWTYHPLVLQLACAVSVMLTALILRDWVVLLFLCPIGVLPAWYLHVKRVRRVVEIERQFGGWLLLVVDALDSKMLLSDAVDAAAGVAQNPLRRELLQLRAILRAGTPFEDAVNEFCLQLGSRAITGAWTPILVAEELGGDLVPVVRQCAETLQELERFESVVRERTVESKTQLMIISMIPPMLLCALHFLDHHWMASLVETSLGGWIWLGSLAGWALVMLWTYRLLDPR
ncbi:MAG: type II secretion system F family protein [Myxococcota bacterium]